MPDPARDDWALDLHDDYPRWLLKEHELDGTLDDAMPVEAVFEMTDTEFAALESKWGPGVVPEREVRVMLLYGDGPFFEVSQMRPASSLPSWLAVTATALGWAAQVERQ